ncbi:hypothetical protein CANARDRAFT_209057 [[Candida] arabinofermentans NRRL YB-2248]|uniref:PSP1 C-terminal domain-containing protein n=1 Tax=[Candida] arabinofermentans NRRL YB-2248 TaxID=983967 RepID=A0A1E4SVV6_9ASCO|nr:hypothetical protein CANARDRAFT_209057 [[Candida] arabinofermentans NRRL YB-2248]
MSNRSSLSSTFSNLNSDLDTTSDIDNQFNLTSILSYITEMDNDDLTTTTTTVNTPTSKDTSFINPFEINSNLWNNTTTTTTTNDHLLSPLTPSLNLYTQLQQQPSSLLNNYSRRASYSGEFNSRNSITSINSDSIWNNDNNNNYNWSSPPPPLPDFQTIRRYSYDNDYLSIYNQVNLYFTSPNQDSLNLLNLLKNLNNSNLPKFQINSSYLNNIKFYLICFKSGRLDVFYLSNDNPLLLNLNDLVIVEADRGFDLGKVVKLNISIDEARLLKFKQFKDQQAVLNTPTTTTTNNKSSPPILQFPKSIIRLATFNEIQQLISKNLDEEKSLNLCQLKIKSHNLTMLITDCEFQFDRKKLTFYYNSNLRIDFRNLVKELFKIYKTRIWMCKQQFQQLT